MTVVIELIDNFAIWIYIACALTVLVYLRVIYLAKKERGASLFTIEKEVATGRAYRAIFTILGLLAIVVLVAFVDVYLAPSLGIAVAVSTPEGPLILPTPTVTPVPPTPTATATRGPLVRPTPPWTPTPEPSPTAVVLPATCPDPGATITYPGRGQRVSGAVEIRGTAQIDDFSYYKVEFWLGDGGSEIHVIGETRDTPVQNGVLVVWNTGNLSGPATLRLSVVKSDGNFVSCDVPVVVGQG
jgi:hypothetical protein